MFKFMETIVDRLFRWFVFSSSGKAPYATRLLRSPGEWPRSRMRALWADMILGVGIFLGFAIGGVFGFFALLLPAWLQWNLSLTAAAFIMCFSLVVATLVLLLVMRRRFSEVRNYQIGYYGELRVAEMLERLGRPDWHVFHGFNPVNKFGREWGDIDHIVICPYGVFCVETKAFRKLPDERKNKLIYTSGKTAGTLRYAGSGQEIPHNPLPRFQEKVRILHEQLKNECGGHGYIARILVIPEWEVEREGADKWELVCSKPDEIKEFIEQSEVRLEASQIKEIAEFFDRELRERLEESH